MSHSGAIQQLTLSHPAAPGANLQDGSKQLGDNDPPSRRETDFAELIKFIIVECGNPVHVLELYYWSQKSGLREAMRTPATLPEQKRAAIQAFLAMAQKPESISVNMTPSGERTLYWPDVAANLDAFRKAIA